MSERESVRAELAAAYAGIMAVAVLNMMPALAAVLAQHLGLQAQTIGRFAACDSIGALLGTLIAAGMMRGRSLRRLTRVGLVILVIADAACGLSDRIPFLLAARLIGGSGGGLVMGISFAVFAAARPERGIALWSIGQLVFGFLAITLLPSMTAALGWQSAFMGLALLAAAGLFLARYLPDDGGPRGPAASPAPRAAISVKAAIGILGVVFFYFGQGAFWPYLEVVGLTSGISRASVEVSLSAAAASALAGSIVVLLAGNRFGCKVPLLLSFALTIAAIGAIRAGNEMMFRLAISTFTFAWPVFSAYQFGLIADHNPSGRVAALVTAANWAGLTAGPLIAGELLASGAGARVQWLSILLDAAALLTLLPLMQRGARSPSGPLAS